jgi:hypothetical protein
MRTPAECADKDPGQPRVNSGPRGHFNESWLDIFRRIVLVELKSRECRKYLVGMRFVALEAVVMAWVSERSNSHLAFDSLYCVLSCRRSPINDALQ